LFKVENSTQTTFRFSLLSFRTTIYRSDLSFIKLSLHVVQEVQRFANELISVLEETLLNLGLAGGVEIVRVGGPWVDVFNHWENVDDILLVEKHNVLLVERVFAKLQLERESKRILTELRESRKIAVFS
jgi:hypothetical protein